jgi:hypothetical protein
MPQWKAVSKTDHLESGWTRFKDYRHAAQDALVPVMAAELVNLVPVYPLCFSVNPSDNTYQFVAVLSLQAGLNLFLDSNLHWQAPYVPAHYRSYPFNLLPDNNGQLTLCYDGASDLVQTPAQPGQVRLLNKAGEISDELKQVVSFLTQCQQNRQLTQAMVNQLAEHNLIQPWDLKSRGLDDDPKPVKGLYHIHEPALKDLAPKYLSALVKSGALALAYAQLLSETRLQDFTARFEARQQPPAADLDLFGEDDMISFE